MGTISINGVTYSGNNVVMQNGRIFIDGVEQKESATGRVELVVVNGPLQNLTVDGSVQCGDVLGSIQAGGSVQCEGVNGSINAGGSVHCGPVGGAINAGGSVRHG